MKKAAGILELLIVLVIIIVLYFSFLHGNQYGRKNPFDDGAKVQSQQELIDKKIDEIQHVKTLNKNIMKNTYEGN